MLRVLLALTFLLLLAQGAGESRVPGSPPVQDISIVRLIANPDAYDGKPVRLIGYCVLDFEGEAVYLHREDYTWSITVNAIWIDLPADARKNKRAYHKKYVIVQGIFSASDKGHEDAFGGSLRDISRLEPWRPHGR